MSDSTNAKLDNIVVENHELRVKSDEYFQRTEVVERDVALLKEENRRLERSARDSARAAQQGVSTDEVAVVGLPVADLPAVRDTTTSIADKLGYPIGPEAVVDVREANPRKRSSSSENNNYNYRVGQNLIADTGEAHPTKLFVTFAYAELREVFLSRAADIRIILAADFGFPNVDNMWIEV